jgi:hypothetical protein
MSHSPPLPPFHRNTTATDALLVFGFLAMALVRVPGEGIEIEGLNGYQGLVRLLLGPDALASSDNSGWLRLIFTGGVPNGVVIQQLTNAFQSNT